MKTESAVCVKAILHGYEGMLQALSQVSVDVAQQELLMPVIMAVQNKVRKYQRKDPDEAVIDWRLESEEIDAQLLTILSHITVHPESSGIQGLTDGILRRTISETYNRLMEPIRMYLAKEAIVDMLRQKGFDGDVEFEQSDIDPTSGLVKVRMSMDSDPSEDRPVSTSKTKSKKVH